MASLLGGGAREYVLKIVADVKDAIKGVDDVSTKTSGMKDKMLGVGKAVAAGLAAGAVIKFGTDVVNAAADADDAMDVVNAAFGTSAKEIEKFSKSSATNMGLSAAAYQTMAAKTGNLLQSMGINSGDAAKSTEVLTQRAADMAAIWGTDVPTAMEAINKGLAGSTKSLQQFGVKVDANEITARAMAKGYVDASGKVTNAGKAIAAQEIILEKTKNMQGGFADNSKDLGSQQDILKAKFEDMQASLGKGLIPVISSLMQLIQPLMDFIANHISMIAPLAGVILGIVAAVKAWNIVQLVMNSTLLANPIFQVVAALAALVAGLVWAYNNVGWFRDAVDAMGTAVVATFNWIKDAVVAVFDWVSANWPLLLAILTGPFGTAAILIIKNWDTIKNAVVTAFNWIKDNWPLLLAILTGPFGIAVLVIQRNWDSIKGFAQSAKDGITNVLSTVANIISAPFKEGARIATDAWNGLINLIRGAWSAINGALHGLADVITYPFRVAIDSIKSLWNNTIGKFSFTVPSWVPGLGGKGWSMPRMASGGIVNRPTIALIGEAGPEAVVPLSNGNSQFGTTVILNVYALTANAEVGRKVWEALREYQRVNGTVT